MFVHLLTCIRAIKGTLIRFLFQAAFEIKINRHLYVHRISFVLVSIGCRVHWPHTLPRLTSEGLSPKLILNHSRQKHMTDSICVLADSCLIVKHWLHCTAPINPVGMWKQREREKKKSFSNCWFQWEPPRCTVHLSLKQPSPRITPIFSGAFVHCACFH